MSGPASNRRKGTYRKIMPRESKRSKRRRAAMALGKAPKDRSVLGLRAGSLPGRNELCPCGSGLKYKRCCGKGPG